MLLKNGILKREDEMETDIETRKKNYLTHKIITVEECAKQGHKLVGSSDNCWICHVLQTLKCCSL